MRHIDLFPTERDKQIERLPTSFPAETVDVCPDGLRRDGWSHAGQVTESSQESSHRSQWERSLRAAADQEDIEAAAREICKLHRGSGMALAIEVGRVVMERIFRGNRLLLRAGSRHEGLGQLASHPDVPYGKTSLWRYAGGYELVTRLSWVLDEPHLTFGHVREVLSVPKSEQERWLREAVSNRWNAKELGERVKTRKRARRGRDKPFLLLRTARQVCELEEQLPIPDRQLTAKETDLLRSALGKLRKLGSQLESILENE